MAKPKKTWREKVNALEQKIHTLSPEWEKRYGKGESLVPRGLDIERLIRETKRGELLTNDVIRETLAKEQGVLLTEPMTTGIFLRIIAEASEEERPTRGDDVTPYWRVLKPDGSINVKFPGGVESMISLLEAEGHEIEPGKGKKPPKVASFEKKLKSFF